MQVCTLLQTDNHASMPPLNFLQAGCPSCRPTNSVKALKASSLYTHTHTHTHTQPFNGPLSGTTRVSQHQIDKTDLDFTEQETVSGSGISWAVCKSAPRSRQKPRQHFTTQVFYRPNALPAAQPTASTHWRQIQQNKQTKKKKKLNYTFT